MKTKNVNAGVGSNKSIPGLMVLLVFAIAGFITILVITSTEGGYDKQYIRHAGELRVLSQEIAKNANEAAAGKVEAFAVLKESAAEFERRWGYLKSGDVSTRLPASPAQVQTDMGGVQEIWNRVKVDSTQILDSQEAVLSLHQVADALSQSIPQLQAEYDEAIAILLANRAAASQVAAAQRQSWLAERILSNVNKILEGGEDAVLAADAFELDAAEITRVYQGMLEGDAGLNISPVRNAAVVKLLKNISAPFQVVSNSADQIIQASPELFQVREAADKISTDSTELLAQTSQLTEHFQVLPQQRQIAPYMGYVCGVLALAIIGLLGVIIFRDTRKNLLKQSDTNERNETAILRLLDEIADLADGDLTTSATVTEDFTGAIADSINFAIDQLRNLVVSINESSVLVSDAARETQSTATALSEASANQAREITDATSEINTISNTMGKVSGDADESAKVAERSVVIANKGADAVQNTIHGMDKIREQIQKTSKQIKRLGESTQEIGDIVSLIDDIADQTNILSLNAAIQASMAGDAGRGFAVVADEVQRLAERSSAATKQIEVLVKTIQADTNEAVISMEHTTAEVVQGARLAQDAGVALGEIEEVSNDLAKLIQEISLAGQQQSESANRVSQTMNVIQEITSQTSSGTMATATSIGELADMAQEMRNSVAGFTLPESVRAMEVDNDDVPVPRFAAVNEAVDASDESSESFDDSTAEAAEESVFDIGDDVETDAELAEIVAAAGDLDGLGAGSTKADFSVDLDDSKAPDDFAFEMDVEQGETDGEQDVSSDSDDKRNISAA